MSSTSTDEAPASLDQVQRSIHKARRGSALIKSASVQPQSVGEKLQERAAQARDVVDRRKRLTTMGLQILSETDQDGRDRWVWVRDPTRAYEPAKVLEELPNGTLKVELASSREVRSVRGAYESGGDIAFDISIIDSLKVHYDDMVKMEDVNEATILHNVAMRFAEDLIYTNIGTILVSVNPFKWMDHLYSSAVIAKHMKLTPGELTTPHIFTIANSAF